MITRAGIGLVLLLGSAATASAQAAQRAPALLIAPAGDSVRLLLTESPPAFGGFIVYRSAAGGAPVRITPRPVMREHDPGMASAIIGAELPAVLRMAGAEDPASLLQTLRTDAFSAHVLALAFPAVAQVLGRNFVDRGVRAGARYDYSIVFTDAAGRETDDRIAAGATIAEQSIAAPAALAAEPVDGALRLTWRYPAYAGDANDLVFGFNVYRAASGATPRRVNSLPVLRNDRGPPVFTDSTAVAGALYQYSVRAIDIARREGPPGGPLAAALVDRTPPAPPTGLTAQPGDGRVHVSWRAPDDPDVVAYVIERGTSLEREFERLTPVPVPARSAGHIDSTARAGTQYFYRVRSVDRAGNESRPGGVVAALPHDHTAPAPPADVRTAAEARNASVSWSPSSSDDVIGYFVYRGTSPDRLVRLVERPVTATTFIDEGYARGGLTPGSRYSYAVTAVDGAYNESERITATLNVADDDAPAPPTAFTLTAARGRYIEITWSASPAVDVGGYLLFRTEVDSARAPPVQLLSAGRGSRSARDTTAVHGRRYRYDLVAVDSAGNRSASASDTIRFSDDAPPPAPRFAAAARSALGGMVVSWERVASADLAGYHVYRALLPTGRFERVTVRPVEALEFRDAGGTIEHWYSVRAVDQSGNESDAGRAVRAGRL
jgi:fibronectin type 3 domain-containing protein